MTKTLEEIKKRLEQPLNQELIRDLRDSLANFDPNDVPDLPILDLNDRDFDTQAVALKKPSPE